MSSKKPKDLLDDLIEVGNEQIREEYEYLMHYKAWIKTRPKDIEDLEAFKEYLKTNLKKELNLNEAYTFLDSSFESLIHVYQMRSRISKELFQER